MALRLRRGTDAERLLITPLQGELIYTIDTKQLYAGDGTTAGGTLVSAEAATTLAGLTDTDVTGIADGDVLTWNNSTGKWEPLAPVISADGIVEGSNYRINIAGDDSTILVNTATGRFTGSLQGDVTGSVFSDDSTLLVDGINGALLGTVIGTINTAEPAQVDVRDRPTPAITLITNGGEGGIELYSEYYAARQTGANLKLYSHNGTYENRTPITSNEILGQLDLGGYLVGPGQSLDVAPISIRGVLVTESDGISTFPLSKLELLVLNSPNPTTAVRATLDHLGTFSSPAIKPGTYADATARDAAITSPEAGMMIFVTDGDGAGNPKFQGNLDGTTGGWVNLN